MDKSKKLSKENLIHTTKVAGFLAVSGALTALVEFLPTVDLGIWTPVVMGFANLGLVVVTEWLNKNR